MGRLTTDDPKTNIETIMNYAYARNNRVKLRYANGNEDVDLCDYIEQQEKMLGFDCGITSSEVMDGSCSSCDCVLAILNIVSIQAAELRERLKHYEDDEAAPVVHGKWINTNPPSRSDNIVCSACNYDSIARFNYCPKCGSKMDLEEGDRDE